jgi:hypothetical protein
MVNEALLASQPISHRGDQRIGLRILDQDIATLEDSELCPLDNCTAATVIGKKYCHDVYFVQL